MVRVVQLLPRCSRCRARDSTAVYSLDGEVVEGSIQCALCTLCSEDLIKAVHGDGPIPQAEPPDEDEEDDVAIDTSPCLRCEGPNADNQFVLARQYSELEGRLCGTCARLLLKVATRPRDDPLRR
jgi:hypothetical protein